MRPRPVEDELWLKSLENLRLAGQFGAAHLPRHHPVALPIPRLIDRSHTALPELPNDFVAIAQDRARLECGEGGGVHSSAAGRRGHRPAGGDAACASTSVMQKRRAESWPPACESARVARAGFG